MHLFKTSHPYSIIYLSGITSVYLLWIFSLELLLILNPIFTTERIGDANFPNYMDSSVPLYTPASHVSLSEQFEPPVYSTMTSSDADNNVDEMAPVVESIAEDVDEPDSVVSETSCTRMHQSSPEES